MFKIYILKSRTKPNWSYVGSTQNLQKRFSDHNQGKVRSTKYYRPLFIVHTETIKNQETAIKRERYLKSGCGREEKNSIINNCSGVV